MAALTVGSLFSGVGGLDLGLERAGMQVKWQCEVDPYARKVLKKHWPDIECYEDVRRLHNTDTGRRWDRVRYVDVLCGGFPCQDVSNAGKREGIDGPQSRLWSEYARLVDEIRPAWVIIENVPALRSRGLGRVLSDLSACGYDAEWDGLAAQHVGAPHRRDRIWIVAYPHRESSDQEPALGSSRSETIFAGPAQSRGCSGSVANSDRERQLQPRGPELDVGGRTGDGRGEGSAVLDGSSSPWAVEPDVGRVVARFSSWLDGRRINAHESCLQEARTKGIPATERVRAMREYFESSEASRRLPACALCGHPLSSLPCKGGCRPWDLGPWQETDEGLRCLSEGFLGVLAQQGQDVQQILPIRAGSNQRTQAVGSRVDRLKCLGNAVVPQVAEVIGRLVVAAHVRNTQEQS